MNGETDDDEIEDEYQGNNENNGPRTYKTPTFNVENGSKNKKRKLSHSSDILSTPVLKNKFLKNKFIIK